MTELECGGADLQLTVKLNLLVLTVEFDALELISTKQSKIQNLSKEEREADCRLCMKASRMKQQAPEARIKTFEVALGYTKEEVVLKLRVV